MSEPRSGSLLGSSAVMAAGTVVSRMSGFVRGTLLAAALGTGLHADVFNIANTLPNMLYILLAGGVFNAVLVPQLVRAMKNDPDGGEAYTNRVITLAALFLGVVTLVLVVAAPLLMRLFLDDAYFTPELAAQRESVIDFARYCLPQVFFYGMFVLVGQVLNARGRFGPMMWAPIANNVISVAVLVVYLGVFGRAEGAGLSAGFGSHAELLLGLGSTLGIAAQLLVLVPYLKAAGFTFRPRFDFRGAGLGHTMRLGVWTVLFVIANQIAYTVVVRIASSGTTTGGTEGTGYTVYSTTYLLIMTPHSIITVSLATALLPTLSRYASEGRFADLATSVASTLRSSYCLIVPVAALLPVIALPLSSLLWGYGAASGTFANFAPTLAMWGPGLVLFTTHYLMLRGFYSLEQTKRVFFIQIGVAVTNIVLAVVLTRGADPAHTAPLLALAWAGGYLVGSVTSALLLSRQLGGLGARRTVRFAIRLALAVAVATVAAYLVRLGLEQVWPVGTGHGLVYLKFQAAVQLAVIGAVDGLLFLVMTRIMRVTEVTDVTHMLSRKLARRG